MNKSRYVPFERNRYFYGKLLTVRDFMSEQTYVSDKRRLINRLMFGSGVMSGLQVVAVDDKTLSIETGAALDQLGREIVLPSPVTLKLSMLDGFTNNEFAKNVYLCIAYDEKGKEPVHSVTGGSGREEEISEHNRVLESYRLFVREQAPQPSLQEYDHLIEDTSILYEDAQVRILQTIPRFLEPEQGFELKLTVEKTLQTPHIELEYEPDWTGVEAIDELPEGKVKFSEPTDGGQTSYTKVIRMRALPIPASVSKVSAVLGAKSGTSKLIVGDKLIQEVSRLHQQTEICEEPADKRMLDAFYGRSLDRVLESPSEPCVYLARIHLLQMGATYAIDSIEPMPFHDYVLNPSMLYKVLAARDKTVHSAFVRDGQQASATALPEEEAELFPNIQEEFRVLGEEEEAPPEKQVASGIAEISILPPPKKKWYHRRQRNFFSDEMEHGLGEGPVLITAGLSDETDDTEVQLPEMWDRKDAVYYGPQQVFAKSEYEGEFPQISIGIIHYPKNGTFRLGVRVHQKTDRTKLRIRWWAVKQLKEDEWAVDMVDGENEQSEKEAAATRE